MMSGFNIKKSELDSAAVFELQGHINEDSDLKDLSQCQSPAVIIDFNAVETINSCGVREWMHMLSDLKAAKKITYKNARKLVVMQFNQVRGFVGEKCKVETFYAPYFCEECDEEREVLLTAQEASGGAPAAKCPDCGKEMEFDALEDQYFEFLENAK